MLHFFLCIQSKAPAQGTGLPTFRVALPLSVKTYHRCPHRHTQRPNSKASPNLSGLICLKSGAFWDKIWNITWNCAFYWCLFQPSSLTTLISTFLPHNSRNNIGKHSHKATVALEGAICTRWSMTGRCFRAWRCQDDPCLFANGLGMMGRMGSMNDGELIQTVRKRYTVGLTMSPRREMSALVPEGAPFT